MEENLTLPSAANQPSLSVAARVAGLSFLLTTTLIPWANFGIQSKLLVEGNATATAQNILANKTLFLSIWCVI